MGAVFRRSSSSSNLRYSRAASRSDVGDGLDGDGDDSADCAGESRVPRRRSRGEPPGGHWVGDGLGCVDGGGPVGGGGGVGGRPAGGGGATGGGLLGGGGGAGGLPTGVERSTQELVGQEMRQSVNEDMEAGVQVQKLHSPEQTSAKMIKEHEAQQHSPRSWCMHCVRVGGIALPHRRNLEKNYEM